MADTARNEIDTIEHRLLTRAQTFEAGQAIRLLARIAQQRGHQHDNAVTIKPALSLELANTDVVEIRKHADQAYELTVSFLGLYGNSSPLPTFYTEDLIAAEQEDKNHSKAFLDLLHQRVYRLFVAALNRYQPHYSSLEHADIRYATLLSGLIGLRETHLRDAFGSSWQCLSYLNLLASPRRSASGLQTLLGKALRNVSVHVEQCVERWVKIPERQRFALGAQSHALGENSLMGDSLRDCTGKISIDIGPLTATRFNEILNHGTEWGLMISLIQYYLNVPLACQLNLTLYPGEAASTQLGVETWAKLGSNTWLFCDELSHGGSQAQLHLA